MSSLLEQRYRRALRLLPAGFRREWEDDMVETFLHRAYRSAPDDPEGVENASPRWPELASIAGLAIRLRLGGDSAVPRPYAWGEAIRRVALIGMLAHVVFALGGVLLSIWAVERLPGIEPSAVSGFTSWWQALLSMAHLLWLPAYLALVFGHRRTATVVAVAAFVPGLVTTLTRLRADQWAHLPYHIAWLVFGALPILALLGFHSGAPAVRGRPWVLAVPVGVVVLIVTNLLVRPVPSGTGLWGLGVTVAGLVAAFARPPAWPLALAILAVVVLGLQTVTMLDFATYDAVGLAGAAGVLVIGVILAGRAAVGLRGLPAEA